MGTPCFLSSSDLLLSPRGPLYGSVLKCVASYRGAWQRGTYQQEKKGASSLCGGRGGGARNSGFCCLYHGGVVAERQERVPLVQPPSPAGSEHREATPGGIFAGDLYKPWKGSRGKEGEREGGREESREGVREEGTEVANFCQSAKPVLVRENLALEVRSCILPR